MVRIDPAGGSWQFSVFFTKYGKQNLMLTLFISSSILLINEIFLKKKLQAFALYLAEWSQWKYTFIQTKRLLKRLKLLSVQV